MSESESESASGSGSESGLNSEPFDHNGPEKLWDAIDIRGEDSKMYLIRWDGINPSTGKKWPNSWTMKKDVTPPLKYVWAQWKCENGVPRRHKGKVLMSRWKKPKATKARPKKRKKQPKPEPEVISLDSDFEDLPPKKKRRVLLRSPSPFASSVPQPSPSPLPDPQLSQAFSQDEREELRHQIIHFVQTRKDPRLRQLSKHFLPRYQGNTQRREMFEEITLEAIMVGDDNTLYLHNEAGPSRNPDTFAKERTQEYMVADSDEEEQPPSPNHSHRSASPVHSLPNKNEIVPSSYPTQEHEIDVFLPHNHRSRSLPQSIRSSQMDHDSDTHSPNRTQNLLKERSPHDEDHAQQDHDILQYPSRSSESPPITPQRHHHSRQMEEEQIPEHREASAEIPHPEEEGEEPPRSSDFLPFDGDVPPWVDDQDVGGGFDFPDIVEHKKADTEQQDNALFDQSPTNHGPLASSPPVQDIDEQGDTRARSVTLSSQIISSQPNDQLDEGISRHPEPTEPPIPTNQIPVDQFMAPSSFVSPSTFHRLHARDKDEIEEFTSPEQNNRQMYVVGKGKVKEDPPPRLVPPKFPGTTGEKVRRTLDDILRTREKQRKEEQMTADSRTKQLNDTHSGLRSILHPAALPGLGRLASRPDPIMSFSDSDASQAKQSQSIIEMNASQIQAVGSETLAYSLDVPASPLGTQDASQTLRSPVLRFITPTRSPGHVPSTPVADGMEVDDPPLDPLQTSSSPHQEALSQQSSPTLEYPISPTSPPPAADTPPHHTTPPIFIPLTPIQLLHQDLQKANSTITSLQSNISFFQEQHKSATAFTPLLQSQISDLQNRLIKAELTSKNGVDKAKEAEEEEEYYSGTSDGDVKQLKQDVAAWKLQVEVMRKMNVVSQWEAVNEKAALVHLARDRMTDVNEQLGKEVENNMDLRKKVEIVEEEVAALRSYRELEKDQKMLKAKLIMLEDLVRRRGISLFD